MNHRLDTAQVVDFIRTPKSSMPNSPASLSEQDVADVVAFVETVK